MTILLLASFVYVVVLGWRAMCRVDTFLDGGGFLDRPEGRRRCGVLIFGARGAAGTARRFGIRSTELVAPNYPQGEVCFSAVLALSDNELENLELCREAVQQDPDIYIVARCANPCLEEIYHRLGASCVVQPEESLDTILAELWSVLR